MEFIENIPPREFTVGKNETIVIKDCGQIKLETDEQVSFITESEKEHDFVRKDWGFYATPSINGRLVDQGFKTALVRNRAGKIYVMVVDNCKEKEFKDYISKTMQKIIEWLDERQLEEESK